VIRDLLQEAATAMRYNRHRTALTMLGMAWGIATVVLLLAMRIVSQVYLFSVAFRTICAAALLKSSFDQRSEWTSHF